MDILGEFNTQEKEPDIFEKQILQGKWEEIENENAEFENNLIQQIVDKKEEKFGIGETIIVDTNNNYDSDSTIFSCDESKIVASIIINNKTVNFLDSTLQSIS